MGKAPTGVGINVSIWQTSKGAIRQLTAPA